jgi:glutathione-regulated potassium-efflux system ancillary protein KefG
MSKILILFAHPALEKSRVHVTLLNHVKHLQGITVNDLYQNYPDFDIDIEKEQDLLLQHDIMIWQHPFYWYSAPALLKQWQDLVLEHGWAYGKTGHKLDGKKIFNAITSGGSMESYLPEGPHHCTVNEFLRPFERTAQLCRMTYLPPFWVSGTHKMEKHQMDLYGLHYQELLTALRDDTLQQEDMVQVPCLNEIFTGRKTLQS